MEILEFKKGNIYIIGLRGRLDASTSPPFGDKFLGLIDQGETDFLIDCSRLEYISSAGLRVFFQAARKIEDRSGRMFFCALSNNVRKVFDMVELSTEFPICASEEEALEQMEKE